MKIVYGAVSALLVLSLSGCGGAGEASPEKLKSTLGMSKDEVEARFGKPYSSHLDVADNHPGGYWIYKVGSNASCKLRFDLPPRVVGVDC